MATPAAPARTSVSSNRARLAFFLAIAGMFPAALGGLALLVARIARPGNELPLNTSTDYFWVHWLGWSIIILMLAAIPAFCAVPFAGYAAKRHPNQARRRVALALACFAVAYVAWVAYERTVAPRRYQERLRELEE